MFSEKKISSCNFRLIIILLLITFLVSSLSSFTDATANNLLKGYLHVEQAETKYDGQVENQNPGQPFTRVQLSLSNNFLDGNILGQYDLSYEAYQMEKNDNDATGHILSNKMNIQKNFNHLNLGLFVNYSENRDRGDNLDDDAHFWFYGVQANKFFDDKKIRIGGSFGEVRAYDFYTEGFTTNDPNTNYNYYFQKYFDENLRAGYAYNIVEGRRDDNSNANDMAEANSHLVNMEYLLSDYPITLTASYELIEYRPGASETEWPDAKEIKFGIKYIFGAKKSLLAFDKNRISHQPNVENYWTHLANEIE